MVFELSSIASAAHEEEEEQDVEEGSQVEENSQENIHDRLSSGQCEDLVCFIGVECRSTSAAK